MRGNRATPRLPLPRSGSHQQVEMPVTAQNLPPQLERRKFDLALADLCPGISAVMKSFENSPVAKLANSMTAIERKLGHILRLTRLRCEALRRERRAQCRAGLSRAPRRRTASTSIRRATADSGGSSDGDEPPRPCARGPPPSRVRRAASGTTRGTDASP